MLDDISIPAVDTIDLEILMHRDIHFGGHFELMLQYYKKGGVGVMPDFDISRIKNLMKIEIHMGKNLSEALLPMQALDTVNDAKDMYIQLREVYENSHATQEALLLSDLILTEEDHPAKEIEAIALLGPSMTKLLLDLLKTDVFYDPLYPGYGRTPIFAAECIAKIQDEKAIPVLFETLGQDNFFTDEAILQALKSFGDKAEKFLLHRLMAKPFSKDNELAAIALTSFTESEAVAKVALNLLKDPLILKWPSMLQYLVLACSGLEHPTDRQDFIRLRGHLPQSVHPDVDLITKQWSSSIRHNP